MFSPDRCRTSVTGARRIDGRVQRTFATPAPIMTEGNDGERTRAEIACISDPPGASVCRRGLGAGRERRTTFRTFPRQTPRLRSGKQATATSVDRSERAGPTLYRKKQDRWVTALACPDCQALGLG